jgi:hypothetical protein
VNMAMNFQGVLKAAKFIYLMLHIFRAVALHIKVLFPITAQSNFTLYVFWKHM